MVTLEVLGQPEHRITFHRAVDEDSFRRLDCSIL